MNVHKFGLVDVAALSSARWAVLGVTRDQGIASITTGSQTFGTTRRPTNCFFRFRQT